MDQYLKIFKYLKAFAKLRHKTIYDINSSQYQTLFLDKIPNDDITYNYVKDTEKEKRDYWLEFKKPKSPKKPKLKLPSKLIHILDEKHLIDEIFLYDKSQVPNLKEIVQGEMSTQEYSDLDQIFKQYINNQWPKDLKSYHDKNQIYKKDREIYKKNFAIYSKIFKFYEDLKNHSETHELIIAVGLFSHCTNEKRTYYRHFITQLARIEYYKSTITIQVNDIDPKVEREFIADKFDAKSISQACTDFENIIKDEQMEDLDLLDSVKIKNVLKNFSDQIGISEYHHNIQEPKNLTLAQTNYAPALILRKKNTNRFSEIYQDIINKLELSSEVKNIQLIDKLLKQKGQNSSQQTGAKLSQSYGTSSESLYFPNPYNDEQIKILEKIQNEQAVLVQGPPGTGKSHTIANLICHLLSQGNKILVTSYTKRALEVLKNKLPTEYQELVVHYLGNDQQSKQDLAASVNAIQHKINHRIDNTDQIISKKQELKDLKEDLARATNQRKRIIKKDTERITYNSKYSGIKVDILSKLRDEEDTFKWYQDSYHKIRDVDLKTELEQFIQYHKEYNFKSLSDFNNIVDLKQLPEPSKMDRYVKLLNFLKQKQQLVTSQNLNKIIEPLKAINILSQKISQIYQSDLSDLFIKKLTTITQLEHLIKGKLPSVDDLKNLDENLKITYPTNKTIIVLKHDANKLLSYCVKNNNKIEGIVFNVKKHFLPTEIKEKLYMIQGVKINGSACDTNDELRQVIKDLNIKQKLNELSSIHNIKIDIKNKAKFIQTYKDIINKSKQIIELTTQAKKLKSQIENISCLKVHFLKTNNSEELLKRVEYSIQHHEQLGLNKLVQEVKTYLGSKNLNPSLDTKESFPNPKSYKAFFDKAYKLNQFKTLQQKLSTKIPKTIELILQNQNIQFTDLQKALFFKDAKFEVQKISSNDIKILDSKIKDLKLKEKELILWIGSKQAWQYTMKNLEDSDLSTELSLYKSAISKMGKTENKRTQKWRKVAKEKMQSCKNAIPCWIMPLQQLVDTISLEKELYDYIIIDEASQLGVDAILLLYLAKKIIIVGDDQQIAPESIGINYNQVAQINQKYLEGIQNKEYYGTDHSFFDLAAIYFKKIVLTEHFRCMPEIIKFSNDLCYKKYNTPLLPLRSFSKNRLEPLKHYYCDNGYVEGKSSSIKNVPEAEALVDKMKEFNEDPRYKNKTFGVISLQGDKQQEIIRSLILKTISDQDYRQRNILCGNPASFQGDERDVIFLSLVTAHNHKRMALTKPRDIRSFNVAVSRAKDQVCLFHSILLDDIKNQEDLRFKLLEHVTQDQTEKRNEHKSIIPIPRPKILGTQPKPFRSWFEIEVYNEILKKNYQVIPAYKVAGYEIDLVPICSNGAKLAVECDGDYWHSEEHYNRDMQRQEILERVGWRFIRIRESEYLNDKDKALNPLWEILKK